MQEPVGAIFPAPFRYDRPRAFGDGMVLGPGPGPGMPGDPGGGTWGPNPWSRQSLLNAPNLSPVQILTAQRVGFMPGPSTNILARLQQSGCCPGARSSGGEIPGEMTGKSITCANGSIYQLQNWQGGIRAQRVIGGGPADCDTVQEGTWALVERGADASDGLGRLRKRPGLG